MKRLIFRGPVLTASGYGVHARQLLRGLINSKKFDISVLSTSWGQTPFVSDVPGYDEIIKLSKKRDVEAQHGVQYDVSVQVTIPNEFQKLARFNVGVTAGIEVDRVSPEWIVKTNEVIDVVVVPSLHSAKTFSDIRYRTEKGDIFLQKPVVIAPEGIDTSIFNSILFPEESLARFDFEPSFNFLFVGLGLDKGYGEDRKNISTLVKLFCERFKGNKDVGLVLKVSMVNNSLLDKEMCLKKIRDIKKSVGCDKYPVINLVHGRLSEKELALLYKHPKVKAFVTLTHGEGWGLPIIEAAACGLPVIATEWSGHLDFLKVNDVSLFVPIKYTLQEIPDNVVWNGVMEKGTRWAVPDDSDVKVKLAKVVVSYDKPLQWAKELSKHVTENYDSKKAEEYFAGVVWEFFSNNTAPNNILEFANEVKKKFAHLGDKTLLYTMPASSGDVYMSTAVIDCLRKKFPEHKIIFATNEKYTSILKGNKNIDMLVQWEQWMTNVPLCDMIFDEVYTPNLGVQLLSSNWVHNGKERKLAEEIAAQCHVKLEDGEYKIELEKPKKELPKNYVVVNTGPGIGQWKSRNYKHWNEVVHNLKKIGGFEVIQVGLENEEKLKEAVDFRGKTENFNQLAYVVKNAECVVSIDTFVMHLAGGLLIPHVAMFGSSYATATCPSPAKLRAFGRYLDAPTRFGCKKSCFQEVCRVDPDYPCVNEVSARELVRSALELTCPDKLSNMDQYEEVLPTISGYTHVFNAERHGFPYIESIKSMLGFCDEVIVVDGGSDDGTFERIKAIEDDRVKLIVNKWDWEIPGMDGLQKAFGRAQCVGDFCWQQDADEVVHERDYDKIKNIVKRFPSDVDLMHLPVVELWGLDGDVRTDRHSWKWRFSRNKYEISHGIHAAARVFDEKNKKVHAKKGMSDGCEYIDPRNGEFIRHHGFYGADLEVTRQIDPQEYGEKMNEIFGKLPSIYHYSWADLERKVRNFKEFWNKCWSNLYNDPTPEDRFPDVKTEDDVKKKAIELFERGGEHEKAKIFKLELSQPALMKEWLDKARSR